MPAPPPFPDAALLRRLAAAGQLSSVLETYADVLLEQLALQEGDTATSLSTATALPEKQVAQIVQAYLRQAAVGSINADGPRLRAAVYEFVFSRKLLLHTAVETLWNILLVFALENVKATQEYLDSSPAVLRPKVGRLLSALARMPAQATSDDIFGSFPADITDPARAGGALTVLLGSEFRTILDKDWLESLDTRTPLGRALHSAAKALYVSPDAHALMSMFPQLTPKRAAALLRGKTLAVTSQQLLDQPHLLEARASGTTKRFVELQKNRPVPLPDVYELRALHETTAALVDAMDRDEDPDDEEDPEGAAARPSEADRRVAAVEHTLFAAWDKDPAPFARSARSSETRRRLRQATGWTDEQIEGWASMLARSPRQAERLRWRATLGSINGSGGTERSDDSSPMPASVSGKKKDGRSVTESSLPRRRGDSRGVSPTAAASKAQRKFKNDHGKATSS